MSALIAHYSKWDWPRLLLGETFALGYTGLGIFLVSRPSVSAGVIVLGTLCTLFFAGWAVMIVARLFDTRAVLRIDEFGIFYRRAVDRALPWSAIARISETRFRGQRFYLVESSIPLNQFIDSRLKTLSLWWNRVQNGNGFVVSTIGLDASFDEVGNALRRFGHRALL